MAEFGDRMTVAFEAAADLRSMKYHFVQLSAANKISVATSDVSAANVGVLEEAPNTGEFGRVCYFGKTKVMANGSVTVNGLITTNGSGRAADATSGDYVLGRALEASGADGDIITVLLYGLARDPGL